MNRFKPMLAVDCGDVKTLTFPLFASTKLDGVRCLIRHEGALSRSLKPIPNRHVQDLLEGLPIGFDGELIAGDPCAPDAYRKTVSMIMAEDKPIDGLVYRVFDTFNIDAPFHVRLDVLAAYFGEINNPAVVLVSQIPVTNLDALLKIERGFLAGGYEGVILRKMDSPYKFGRSTRKEGYLLKLKRFADSEAEVIGVVELMHNGNEAKTNALGRTERSTHKAGKEGMGVLGALKARDVKTGVEFEIGTGFTAAERAAYWALGTGGVIGRLAKYKYFPVGVKDKPRHPVFLGWRDRLDT